MSKILLFILVIGFQGFQGFGQETTVILDITGIRSDTGLVRLAVCDHKDQFPKDPSRTYAFDKHLLEEGILRITLIDLPPGIYSISVLDDEDGNDKMKYNLLRMPKEGFGFSNNIKPRFKSPPYEKCTIQVGEGETHLEIEIQYFREKS